MVFLVVVFVFIAFAVAIVWRPACVLAFAICVYPFEQWAQANSAFFAINSSALNFGLGLLTLFALACCMLRGKNPVHPITPAMWTWLALYVFAACSVFWSVDRDTSYFLFKYHAPYVITFVALLPMVIQDPHDARTGLLATLFFGTVVMLLLMWDTSIHAWGRTITVDHGVGVVDRVGQTRGRLSPLAVAEMAGEIALIAILMNFVGLNRFWQLSRWFVVFVAFALIYRSGSRGQLIATMGALLTFVTLSRGTNRTWGWLGAAMSVFFLLSIATISFFSFADLRGRWDLDRMGNTIQSTRWSYSVDLLTYWSESSPFSWLFGLGSSASYDRRVLGHYCHVVVAEVLAELGIVGLTMLLVFVAFVVRDGYRLYKMTKNANVERGVVVTFLALFFFQVILSFKERSFLTHTFTFGCGLMICRYAAVMERWRKKARQQSINAWYASQYGASWNQPQPAQPGAKPVSA